MNKSKQESDDEEEEEEEDLDDDEEEDEKKIAVQPPRPKKRRGRPPKNVKNKKLPNTATASSDAKSNDPYDFDADDQLKASTSTAVGDDKGKQWRIGSRKSKEEEDEESLAAKREVISTQYHKMTKTQDKSLIKFSL